MANSKTVNILFCGTGGQGVLKASEVVGLAAVIEGLHVKKSEVHGMAQRGGSVESHLRFGKEVFSPLIPRKQADFLVSLNKEEQLRLKDYLRPKGIDLVKYLDDANLAIKDKRYINTFMVGVLAGYLTIKQASWIKAMEEVLPAKYLEENKKVFFQGKARKR